MDETGQPGGAVPANSNGTADRGELVRENSRLGTWVPASPQSQVHHNGSSEPIWSSVGAALEPVMDPLSAAWHGGLRGGFAEQPVASALATADSAYAFPDGPPPASAPPYPYEGDLEPPGANGSWQPRPAAVPLPPGHVSLGDTTPPHGMPIVAQPQSDPPAGRDRARAEVLPQRIPAAPDVPAIPEGEAGEELATPAEVPELARIATYLKHDDAPPAREGFDVDAVLAAVREVAGVRGAELRRSPGRVHTLRLDLADGADPGQVSRAVARLLSERMGLSAAVDSPRTPEAGPAWGASTAVADALTGAAAAAATGYGSPAGPGSRAPADLRTPADPASDVRVPADSGSRAAAELRAAGDSVSRTATDFRGPDDPGSGAASGYGSPVGPGSRAAAGYGQQGDSGSRAAADFRAPADAMSRAATGYGAPAGPGSRAPADHGQPGDSGSRAPADLRAPVDSGSRVPADSAARAPAESARAAAVSRAQADTAYQSRRRRPAATVRAPADCPPASAPERPNRPLPSRQDVARVVLDHVQVSTFGLDATVEVRLAVGERRAVGEANGPAVDGYVLRLCAVSAAVAVDQLLVDEVTGNGRGRCFVEHASVVPFGSCEVAVVVVLLVCNGWVEQLAGSALVAGDPRQAVVRATLAAVNRRLESLLP